MEEIVGEHFSQNLPKLIQILNLLQFFLFFQFLVSEFQKIELGTYVQQIDKAL